MRGICIMLLSLIYIMPFGINAYCQTGLPKEINKLFFEDSKFSEPILIELPEESSLNSFNEITENPDIYESGVIPSVNIKIGKEIEEYDKYLLSFLVKNGYVKIESKIQTTHSNYGDKIKTHHFLFYTEKINKNLIWRIINNQKKPFLQVARSS